MQCERAQRCGVVVLEWPSGRSLPWVVEFRNAAWVETDIAEWLAARGVACATTDRLDLSAPALQYIRLLGTDHSVARFDACLLSTGPCCEKDEGKQQRRRHNRLPPDSCVSNRRVFFCAHLSHFSCPLPLDRLVINPACT